MRIKLQIMVRVFFIVLVKESGNTVHLIAKMGATQQEATTTNTNTQQQQPQTQQQPQSQPQQQQPQQQFNPFANLFGGLGMGQPQATTITFGNMNDLNQGLGGILGSLGIRIPPVGGNVQQSSQQQQQQQPPRPTINTQVPPVNNSNPFQTPPTNTQRTNQQNNQPTSSFNLPNVPPQQQQPSSQQPTFTVSN
jgi:hypothetical protein